MYYDQRVFMTVCLFVCPCIIARSYFTLFSVHVTVGRGSVLFCRQCDTLCTSGFVYDVMLYNIANGQNQLETTRMFRRVRQIAAPGRSLPSPIASCYSSTFLTCRNFGV